MTRIHPTTPTRNRRGPARGALILAAAWAILPTTAVVRADPPPWHLLPAGFQEARADLQRDYPGVRFQYQWGRVHAVYGRPIAGGDSVVDSAEEFLDCYGLGLFGLTREELILTRVVEPEPGQGPAYAHYAQIHGDDTPVHGASLVLRIGNGNGYPVKFVSSTLHPSPGGYLRARNIDYREAIDLVEGLFDDDPINVDSVEEVVWALGDLPVHAWALEVVPIMRERERERFFVSRYDGAVLDRRTLYHRFADFTATVKGERPPDDHEHESIQCVTEATPITPMEHVKVHVVELGGGYNETEYTDDLGEATFTDVPATFTVTASMENDWFKLIDVSNSDQVREETGDQSQSLYEFTNTTQDPRTLQMVNAWNWLHFARDTVQTADSTYGLGPKLTIRCNIPDFCNAYYTETEDAIGIGMSIDPPQRDCEPGVIPTCSCGCDAQEEYFNFVNDLHTSSIVVHEYGHHIHEQENNNSPSDPWEENFADAFSAFITGESEIGALLCGLEGECQAAEGLTRDIATTDVRWPSFSTDVYANGRSMAGGYWQMRDRVPDFPNHLYALKILLHSVKHEPQHVSPVVAMDAVIVDDDSDVNPNGDDNLLNGSPNYEAINAGFRKHDLATMNVAYVDIDWSGEAPEDPEEDEDLVVVVTVDPGSLTLVGTDPVKLRYRFNTGQGPDDWATPVPMTYNEQQGEWSADIDTTGKTFGTVIDFYVRVEVTESTKRYTSFPTQAQFDFDDPNAEERDYLTVLVTNAARSEPLATDLVTEPTGWTIPQGHDWEFGGPPLHQFGETPGGDFPYDSDETGGSTFGPYCYFTDGALPSGTPWTLMTSGFDFPSDPPTNAAVVSYAAWVYIRGGNQDDTYLTVEIGNGDDDWLEIDHVTPAGQNQNELQRWIRRRVKIVDGDQLGNGRYLRFTAERDANAQIEVAVDEIRVWGVTAPEE